MEIKVIILPDGRREDFYVSEYKKIEKEGYEIIDVNVVENSETHKSEIMVTARKD